MLRTVSHLGLFSSKLHTDLDSPAVFQAYHTVHEEERDQRGLAAKCVCFRSLLSDLYMNKKFQFNNLKLQCSGDRSVYRWPAGEPGDEAPEHGPYSGLSMCSALRQQLEMRQVMWPICSSLPTFFFFFPQSNEVLQEWSFKIKR